MFGGLNAVTVNLFDLKPVDTVRTYFTESRRNQITDARTDVEKLRNILEAKSRDLGEQKKPDARRHPAREANRIYSSIAALRKRRR